MTMIVAVAGTILAATRARWTDVYQLLPGRLSFNRVYDWLLERLQIVSRRVTHIYMTGSVRHYMLIILGATLLGTFLVMFTTGGVHIRFNDLAPVSLLEVIIVVMMVIAAVATLFAKNNLTAILILGVVGFGTAMLFVIYRAPDLALTQLVIETITVAIFLLTFYHLPKLRKREDTKREKTINLIISVGFGAMMTLVGIFSFSSESFAKISDYFIETSHSIGGGNNIVNVILVDMRGFDTLFEITVLGIAALAVFALIKFNRDKGAR